MPPAGRNQSSNGPGRAVGRRPARRDVAGHQQRIERPVRDADDYGDYPERAGLVLQADGVTSAILPHVLRDRVPRDHQQPEQVGQCRVDQDGAPLHAGGDPRSCS